VITRCLDGETNVALSSRAVIVDASDGTTPPELLLPSVVTEEPRTATGPRPVGVLLTDPTGIEARAVTATLACIARVGLAKTTLDDIAREAGCGRATLYRYFGSRRTLVELAAHSELAAVGGRIRSGIARADTLEDALTELLVGTAREHGSHDALRTMLEVERGTVLPFVTFRGADRLLELSADAFGPGLERFFAGTDRAHRARRCASWTTRIALTYLLARDRPVDLTDEESARTLVRRFALPAFAPAPTLG
jgi:AcrR family transcriptional regulator